MQERQVCVGCGKKSPETETNYTLISAQFGWRLSRTRSPDGSTLIEWRCPTCWREYKKARTSAPDGFPAPPSSGGRVPTPAVRAPTAPPESPWRPASPPGSSTPQRRSSSPAGPGRPGGGRPPR